MRYGWVGLLLLAWCALAQAQTRLYIDIDQVGSSVLPIALPKLLGEEAAPELGRNIRLVIREDLERSGLFRVADPATYIDAQPQSLERLRYQNWAAVGVAAVIAGRLRRVAGGTQIRLEFVLHDMVQQRPRFNGREYQGPEAQYREMAHRFSDLVFHELTGEPGPFDTQVVCVEPHSPGKDIILMDYDGHHVQRLVADGALNLEPMLSPDGLRLAYTSYREGTPQLYLRRLDDGADERVTSGAGLAMPGSWSPDGRYLALSRTEDGNSDLYIYDTKRQRLRRLTKYWGIDVSPRFAPDGRRLVFTSDRSGSPQLYLTDIYGSEPVRLTYEGSYNTSPVWSPRGEAIAFVGRTQGEGLDVYTIHADGSKLRRLTAGGGTNEAPSWAPHGRFVMYTTQRGNGWQRRMIRVNGEGNVALPSNGHTCLSPQWVARTPW
jgi:TolB protein